MSIEKEIQVEIITKEYTSRDVEVEFPFFCKQERSAYEAITYYKCLSERECICITVPKNIQDNPYVKSYFDFNYNNYSYSAHIEYSLRESPQNIYYNYSLSSEEEFKSAFDSYKNNFLNQL